MQDKVSKKTFFSNSFHILKQLRPDISHQKLKNVTGGKGVKKVPKVSRIF
jgi:hypothetical protein